MKWGRDPGVGWAAVLNKASRKAYPREEILDRDLRLVKK